MVGLMSWRSVDGQPLLISSFGRLLIWGFLMSSKWSLVVVFVLQLVDILFVAVADTLFMAVVDRLEFNILAVDISAVASLVDKNIDFDFVDISEFETGDRGFYIDFLIVGYLNGYGSRFVGVFVFHNSSMYAFLVATVNWLIRMNTTNSGNNWRFPDYCVILEVDKLPDC
ncbi:hypothetical protein G9A89_011597 [Geosiphon pyriformis]|nr:hypothetical protein G9A89_011597 [Geosiphon pyriformis]